MTRPAKSIGRPLIVLRIPYPKRVSTITTTTNPLPSSTIKPSGCSLEAIRSSDFRLLWLGFVFRSLTFLLPCQSPYASRRLSPARPLPIPVVCCHDPAPRFRVTKLLPRTHLDHPPGAGGDNIRPRGLHRAAYIICTRGSTSSLF